jgi:hypothetical protein
MKKKCRNVIMSIITEGACPVCGGIEFVVVEEAPRSSKIWGSGIRSMCSHTSRGITQRNSLSIARGNSTAALVCGILGFIVPFAGIVLAIVAIVLGNSARKVLPESERTVASAGFILGIASLVYSIVLVILVLWMLGVLFLVSAQGLIMDMPLLFLLWMELARPLKVYCDFDK